MARIFFNDVVEEFLGKYGGSIFQDSYGGMQVRGWAKPRNPQTLLSQLRRGDFKFLASSWRDLTTSEKATFISVAITTPSALRLFIGSNINLILIGENLITSYIPSVVPDAMPIDISAISPTTFQIISGSALNIVPAGHKLLLYATTDKFPTLLFTNPSEFQPILFFDEGTDFSSSHDIISDWIGKYGIMRENRIICLKSVIIDKSNGNRSAEIINCKISDETMPPQYIALLTQHDTEDPVITEILNTTGFTFTCTRVESSYYQLLCSGNLPEGKTTVFIGNGNLPFTGSPEELTVGNRLDDTTVLIHTFFPPAIAVDDALKHTPIAITIYP